MTGAFIFDVSEIRRRVRHHIEKCAAASGHDSDSDSGIRVLNDALATEVVCVLRYQRHYFLARSIGADAIAADFRRYAAESQFQADTLAVRISQLGGSPIVDFDGLLSRSHPEPTEGDSLVDLIREDLVAERIVIESLGDMVRFLGQSDAISHGLLQRILITEEVHAESLAKLVTEMRRTSPR